MPVLTPNAILTLLEKKDAILSGHFLLTSGRHSNRYIQCARILEYPSCVRKLARAIEEKFKDYEIDTVASPAMGGIIIGYETAARLKTRFIFAEKSSCGMILKRRQKIYPGEKVLVVEDVCTTGGSIGKVMALVKAAKAKTVGVSCIVDRSAGKVKFHVPFKPLLYLGTNDFLPDKCPLCKDGVPIIQPSLYKS